MRTLLVSTMLELKESLSTLGSTHSTQKGSNRQQYAATAAAHRFTARSQQQQRTLQKVWVVFLLFFAPAGLWQ